MYINPAAEQLVGAGWKMQCGDGSVGDFYWRPSQVCLQGILSVESRLVAVVIKWARHFPRAHIQTEHFDL